MSSLLTTPTNQSLRGDRVDYLKIAAAVKILHDETEEDIEVILGLLSDFCWREDQIPEIKKIIEYSE